MTDPSQNESWGTTSTSPVPQGPAFSHALYPSYQPLFPLPLLYPYPTDTIPNNSSTAHFSGLSVEPPLHHTQSHIPSWSQGGYQAFHQHYHHSLPSIFPQQSLRAQQPLRHDPTFQGERANSNLDVSTSLQHSDWNASQPPGYSDWNAGMTFSPHGVLGMYPPHFPYGSSVDSFASPTTPHMLVPPVQDSSMHVNPRLQSFPPSSPMRYPHNGSMDQTRQIPPPNRRAYYLHHHQPHVRTQESTDRRATALQARHLSSRATHRRNITRYSVDLARSSTSSTSGQPSRRRSREFQSRWVPSHLDSKHFTSQIDDFKKTLPKITRDELPEDASNICDICQNEYSTTCVSPSEEHEVATRLPCGHIFGEHCILHWIDTCQKHKNKITCPMCRKELIDPKHVRSVMAINHHYMSGNFGHGVPDSSPYQREM